MTLLSLPGKLRAGPGQVVSEPGRQDTAWWQVAGGGSWPWGTFKGCGGRRTMAGWRWPTGAEGLPVWTDLRLGSCCLGPHL